MEEYGACSLDELMTLVGSSLDPTFELESLPDESFDEREGDSTFARRLITGRAAENYFESNFQFHKEFWGGAIINTTQFGCGFDFRINFSAGEFFAVEVKGLRDAKGRVNLTLKEYKRAVELGDRYFLYVVTDFREIPKAQVWKNPIRSDLNWIRSERMLPTVSWSSSV